MKKNLCIIFLLLLVALSANAQDIVAFRRDVLTSFSRYFSDAQLTSTGRLGLSATEIYRNTLPAERYGLAAKVLPLWTKSLVEINDGKTHELWVWNAALNQPQLITSWSPGIQIANLPTLAGTSPLSRHPWFFYIGGLFQLNTQQNIYIAFNTRVGFFLLLNRWDLAFTYSASRSGNIELNTSTGISAAGLSSKLYFPIKQTGIIPNIGGEFSYTTTSSENLKNSSFKPFALAGISVKAGPGSVDLGLRIGDQLTTMIGYTLIPGTRKSKSGK